MTTQPFAERISTDLIMKDERFTQGLARLHYLLHSGSLAIVYGQTGVGKSTRLKLFLSHIPQNQFLPIYVHFTQLKSSSLLSLIVSQLGEIPKHTKDRLFLQIMNKTTRSNLTPILIIDEAHLLKSDAFTDLRLLVSSPFDSSAHLKIILSGQEHLRYILKLVLMKMGKRPPCRLRPTYFRPLPYPPTYKNSNRLLHRLLLEILRRF